MSNTNARYRRARRDLAGALNDLTARGAMLLGARRGTLIERARRIRAASIDVVTYAVLAERAAGASWTDIATALGLDEHYVVEQYGPLETQWQTGGGVGPTVGTEPRMLRAIGH